MIGLLRDSGRWCGGKWFCLMVFDIVWRRWFVVEIYYLSDSYICNRSIIINQTNNRMSNQTIILYIGIFTNIIRLSKIIDYFFAFSTTYVKNLCYTKNIYCKKWIYNVDKEVKYYIQQEWFFIVDVNYRRKDKLERY